MITYRNAQAHELDTILDWAAAEGWNPGLDDAAAFWAADPGGFFVAVDGVRPVAAISVVNHTDHFAFLGLYIVTPNYRGRGVGYALWQHALAHAGTRTVGLDGVQEQQANYAASGFVHAGGTTRFAGAVMAQPVSARLATAADIPDLIGREADVTGVHKPAYLGAWFTNTADRKTLLLGGGICTIRKCRSGAKIGPLIAPDLVTARDLIGQAAGYFGPDVIIDVPDAAGGLTGLCNDLGLTPGFQTARMYRGAAPAACGDIFAVTSLELG
ncbi:GNAT family N-acetyltransferase [Yoonia sp. BS5-3]|uniref:GNAT family N-acetyltransferase n=1 Tax=Yoonia phaeophyticola TaxID=3137369 RepID=A0ABZ2V298_9RHOB